MSISIISVLPQRLHELRSQGNAIDLIDVRSPAEYRAGHASGAKLVPLDELKPETLAAQLQHAGGGMTNLCTSYARAAHGPGRLPNA